MADLDRSGEPCYGASLLAAASAKDRFIPLGNGAHALIF